MQGIQCLQAVVVGLDIFNDRHQSRAVAADLPSDGISMPLSTPIETRQTPTDRAAETFACNTDEYHV